MRSLETAWLCWLPSTKSERERTTNAVDVVGKAWKQYLEALSGGQAAGAREESLRLAAEKTLSTRTRQR
jgi:hypothetical protein